METIDLDLIVHGRIIPAGSRSLVQLDYEQGIRVRVPQLNQQDLDELLDQVPKVQAALGALTIREVTEFLAKVGRAWMTDESKWRSFALDHAPRITGYHRAMLANDYFLLGEFLSAPSSLYDQVSAELGNEHIFDEWIPVMASYVRAFGLGLAVHILVGNLPLAGLYSLIRGVIARNVNLAKIPTRDPISTYAFVRSMIEVDPEHPVTRAMSIAYWERGSAVGDDALQRSDVVIVWGGAETITAIGRKAGATPLVAFGPKWSLSALDLDDVDLARAALRLAYEISYYDQEACFSTQEVFVRGDLEGFLPILDAALNRFSTAMPLVTTNRDVLAHRSATMLEAAYRGWETTSSGDAKVIVVPKGQCPPEHPLTRTVFIHAVEDLGTAVAERLDSRTQTLAVYPWTLTAQHRDKWAIAGAERIVELGMSRHPRQGFTHDGMRWLNRIVRIASVERPSSQLYRYNTADVDGLEAFLFERPLATGESCPP